MYENQFRSVAKRVSERGRERECKERHFELVIHPPFSTTLPLVVPGQPRYTYVCWSVVALTRVKFFHL